MLPHFCTFSKYFCRYVLNVQVLLAAKCEPRYVYYKKDLSVGSSEHAVSTIAFLLMLSANKLVVVNRWLNDPGVWI